MNDSAITVILKFSKVSIFIIAVHIWLAVVGMETKVINYRIPVVIIQLRYISFTIFIKIVLVDLIYLTL